MSDWRDHFVALDVETSGFHRDSRILEFSAVEFEGGIPRRMKTLLFNPVGLDWEDPRVQGAVNVHGITKERVRDAPPFDFQVELVQEALSWASVWVAHNATFDLNMLDREFQTLGLSWPRPEGLLACTMSLDFVLDQDGHPGEGWKLHEVATRRGVRVDMIDLHRAQADALLAGHVFLHMARELPDELHEAAVTCSRARETWQRTPKRKG